MDKNESGSPKYWQSLEQWRQDPEFIKMAENEFLSSPLSESEDSSGQARRDFLKLMGASMALTTFGCIRRPAQKIVPYAKRPPEIVLGQSLSYASSFVDSGEAFGVLVTTREGRPIKIEGNPSDPGSAGGMSARAHASILRLYDPDRSTGPMKNLLNEKRTNRESVKVSWESLDKEVAAQLKKGQVAFLVGDHRSPSLGAALNDFSQTFGAKIYRWSPGSYQEVRRGSELAYGRSEVPHYHFDKAKVIVSINSDFIGQSVEAQKKYSQGRNPDDSMSQLYSFESVPNLTGANADYRYRIRPSDQLSLLLSIAHDLIKMGVSSVSDTVKKQLSAYDQGAKLIGVSEEQWTSLIEALKLYKGRSLILAGGAVSRTEQSDEIQVAVAFLNQILGNEGKTLTFGDGPQGFDSSVESLSQFVEAANADQIKTLIIYGANPVYQLSGLKEVSEALKKPEMVVYAGDRNDETGKVAHLLATCHHEMEAWGDLMTRSGVYSIQQPTIRPLHDTRSFGDSLISWAKQVKPGSSLGSTESFYDYVRSYWKKNVIRGEFESAWVEMLQTGIVNRASKGVAPKFRAGALRVPSTPTGQGKEGYELALYETIGLKDGTLANVSWMQEFPDPVTKICWDNYAVMSPADAKREKLKEGDLIELNALKRHVKVPVHIQPGAVDGVIGLALGYGRSAAGSIGDGVGVDAQQFLSLKEGRLVSSGIPCSISSTGECGELANIQGHHSMEGRQIVVEATLKQFQKNPESNIHRHKVFSMWSGHKYKNNKWGMVIDLNQCTGCSACIIACQSENNIPAVGKKYVLKGREMHWIRVDRYYVGEPENPAAVHQPIVCMHCDNAPCEAVCPVLATVHSDEGTNDMIYNRCVGTRYCSNNCPYKVRRFNWFNYVKEESNPLNLAHNPEVTVRSRGVMEKCTFCIHRIKGEKHLARNEKRTLVDGDVKTACQQSCPTNAITFGDLNDQSSEVRSAFNEKNSYELLEEVNAQAAVRYRTKIRNVAELKVDPGAKGHGKSSDGGHH